MLYDAFELQELVGRLPLRICALATWGDWFMISTISNKNEAHLLVYQVKLSSSSSEYEAKLTKTLKRFTSQPITQLAVIPEYGIFLGLADNEIFYADLDHFHIFGHVVRSRNAAYFSVDWQKLRGQVGYGRELRMCVATKKKLQLYEWRKSTFCPVKSDLNFPDTPHAVAWVGDNLIICIKKKLYHSNLDGDNKELFVIGTEPCLYPLMNGEILILKDEMQIVLDSNGMPTQSQPLYWSDQPSCVEHIPPYIIALLPKSLEVWAFEQKIQVQSIRIESNIKFVQSSKHTLIASTSNVFKLKPCPYDKQIQSCIQSKEFELALSVAELIEEQPEEAAHWRKEVMRRLAFYQFTQHKFEASLKNYLEIREDPINVIALYPNLVPTDLRQQLENRHPAKPPLLSGEDLESAMKQLTTYLTQLRYLKAQDVAKCAERLKNEASLQDQADQESLIGTLQIIDTTLLKCYIKFRIPDNYLHLGECERVLRQEQYYKELIDLFQFRGKHGRALKLLHQFSTGPSGVLTGVEPTIEYLQNLTSEHMDHILEHSKWIIKEDPKAGLRIFTEHLEEVRSLPRQTVVEHLSKCSPASVVPYLEHIITSWGEEQPYFHNMLVREYQEGILKLLPGYKKTLGKGKQIKPGEEPGELGRLRKKLLEFLRKSRHYKAADHISSFPQNDLFEERALLLSRLGRHEVALAIYAHVLKEPEMAEEYCRLNCDPEVQKSKNVYLDLIKVYLSPPKLSDLGICCPESTQPRANIKDALSILNKHHQLIDTAKVLHLFPDATELNQFDEFKEPVVQERAVLKRRTQLMKSLLLAEHLQECEFDEVRCKYGTIGCDFKAKRKEMRAHEEDDKLHLHMAIDTTVKLKESLEQMEETILQLKDQQIEALKAGKGMIFSVKNYQQAIDEEKSVISPSFYTRPHGYRMAVEVIPNGCGDSEGSHISVYVELLKGEYDDELPWPFVGDVTIELLNQYENERHYAKTVDYTEENNKRVGSVALGFSGYISHLLLALYLKGDALYFRVSVKHPDHKPWLGTGLHHLK